MFPQILHTGPLSYSVTPVPLRKNGRKERKHEATFLHLN